MRQQGYSVKISAFLPIPKDDIDAQIAALTAIKGNDVNALLSLCRDVKSETTLRSREVDADGNVVPRKPRAPRTASRKKAA